MRIDNLLVDFSLVFLNYDFQIYDFRKEKILASAVRYDENVMKSSQLFTPLFSQYVLMQESPRFIDSNVK